MRKPSKRSANVEVWRRRLEAAENFPGTILEYCRCEGISREALRYWRQRLGSAAVSPFAPVEVLLPTPVARLPDARWVAELILHLHAGGAR